jgi:hypothetical protein
MKTKIHPLIISIAVFTVSSFLVHWIFNPGAPILQTIGYGIFAGCIAGTAFYFIDRNKTEKRQ